MKPWYLLGLMTVFPLFAIDYPKTAMVDHRDDYHGKSVEDPYRWLEDDVRESMPVRDWVTAQNRVTDAYLATVPNRQKIQRKLQSLWNYERYGISPPRHEDYFYLRRGDHYFSFRNDGLQNQSALYVQGQSDAAARLLVDPNQWSEDGTLALANFVPSPSGNLIAYGIQDSGSDWRTWKVLNVSTGQPLDDRLEWLKFTSVAWLPDESGFYYSRYPRPEAGQEFQSLNTQQKVYFHRIGTPQTEDKVVHARPDHPDWGFGSHVTDDGRYLVIETWVGTDDRNRIDIKRLDRAKQAVRPLIDDFTALFDLIGSQDNVLYFRTTQAAPRGRLIAIDLDRPDASDWREVIAESEAVMTGVTQVGEKFVVEYLKDARSQIQVHSLSGEHERSVELPGIGTASGFYGSSKHPETYFHFSSFNQPPSIYRYNVISGERQLIAQSKVAFEPQRYVVKQVFYTSADGTRIPMFITHRKDIAMDGSHPTLLYGYGGFNISIRPGFDPSRIAWLEMGGIYAVANLRGGGEYGEEWHKAGTKLDKQNVFDDFAAAAEYLIDEKYTSSKHLAIYGRSNGGLLIGATINQRPELFAAALPQVGVMDMLRFQHFTAGRFWTDDYGSSANPEEFQALHAYSPYHNIRQGQRYPATMVTTGDTDDRVVPGHSFKYAARLQSAQDENGPPVLIRIDTNAGHADGKPTAMIIDEYADMWAFIARHTGLVLPEAF